MMYGRVYHHFHLGTANRQAGTTVLRLDVLEARIKLPSNMAAPGDLSDIYTFCTDIFRKVYSTQRLPLVCKIHDEGADQLLEESFTVWLEDNSSQAQWPDI